MSNFEVKLRNSDSVWCILFIATKLYNYIYLFINHENIATLIHSTNVTVKECHFAASVIRVCLCFAHIWQLCCLPKDPLLLTND